MDQLVRGVMGGSGNPGGLSGPDCPFCSSGPGVPRGQGGQGHFYKKHVSNFLLSNLFSYLFIACKAFHVLRDS